MTFEIFVSFIIGIFALLSAGYLVHLILKRPKGNPKMIEISNAIKSGAIAYLNRQYKTIILLVLLVTALFYFVFGLNVAVTFFVGALFSTIAGFVGMNTAIRTNVRTTEAAKKGLNEALSLSFFGGSVMGLIVVGLGVIGITFFYFIFGDSSLILGFGFGASFVALFARLGGGIFTKAADIGADLVGKVEIGIPEDDPRNPAVIADNVGDNVGDVAGMGADLFESFCASIIAAMIIAATVNEKAIMLPLLFAGAGIIATVFGTYIIKRGAKTPQAALNNGILYSAILGIILFYIITMIFYNDVNTFLSAVIGIATIVAIGRITDYYTSYSFQPTKAIAEASKTGVATNILAGLANGMISTTAPIIIISLAIIISYSLAGMFGIAMAAVGMLSLAGVAVAIDSSGAISDNAGGIAEMAKLPKKVRNVTDKLDAAGNTAAAIAKGAAIGSAALTAIALFSAYFQITGLQSIDISKPIVIIGLFIGGLMPFIFSALAINAVGRAAFKMVEEVRRQFRTIKGLMQGKAKPDYSRCVDISTSAALKEMIVPSLLAIFVPLVIGFSFGPEAVGGLLAGGILTGLLLAIFMTTGGASWDNAKKYIETGKLGGKGSSTHKAAVVGDTIGDPFKDTAGPSLNILIKIMSIISLLFAALFTTIHLI